MSEEKNIPGPPPPDDFSKTTPNINVSPDAGAADDWDKTNYNFPKQPAADDWGKTVTNIRPIDTEQQDFSKTFYPGSQPSRSSDWGVTRPNINVSNADFGSEPEDFGAVNNKTTPYFQLPEAERAKYQNLPPTPTEAAAKAKKEKEAEGGIPGWVWVSGGLLSMFLFAVAVLLVVLFIINRDTNFVATVEEAPIGSRILVDDVQWGVTEGGTRKLENLAPGRRTIKIVHPNFVCQPQVVDGRAGETPEPIVAICALVELKAGEDCSKIVSGEYDKAERCYYAALKALPDPFTPEQLVAALNILIINFDSNKFEVPNDRLAALKKGAEYIKLLPPGTVLEVGGHTDNIGLDAANQSLSENRANAVRAKLIAFEARGDALQTKGYGATRPKFDNNTEQGKFANRRIEYSIVKQ